MITSDTLKAAKLFAGLQEGELTRLAKRAADVRLEPEEWLIREGERQHFFVLLEGILQLKKDVMGHETDIAEFTAGDFYGEISLLFGIPSLSSLRAKSRCRVARFEAQQLQELIQGSSTSGSVILQTMKERLARIDKYALDLPAARVHVIGSQYDTDCRDIRAFLGMNRIPYEWVDRETELDRIPLCVPAALIGTAVVVDGICIGGQPATVRKVAEALGISTRPTRESYDVVIIGGGPAGLAAAVYGASEGLTVLLIERKAAGGQAGISTRIENYFGFSNGISGDDLSQRALKQATRFGAEMVLAREVTRIDSITGGGYCVDLDGGERVRTRTVVLATGVDWRVLEAEGVERLVGKGVFYGAARADSSAVTGKDIFIVGGGNSAGQAAMFFANYASSITMLIRGAELEAGMSQYLVDQIAGKANIKVETSTKVVSVAGEYSLRTICTVRNGEEPIERHADALYVMIGACSSTHWLPGKLERDANGYINTGRDVSDFAACPGGRVPFLLETNLPGVFCAGDVRHDSIKRVSSAVGEGSMVIAFVHQYLALKGDAT
jgi:thioredoxin reductase (NADPH)